MKKVTRFALLFTLLFGAGSAMTLINTDPVETEAAGLTPYPGAGYSGTVLFVTGSSTYFNTGEADLAVYFYNSSGNAWSDRVTYRVYGDTLRVMLPYLHGNSTRWSGMKVCRYNPGLEPSSSGFDGVYNSTDDILLSSFLYGHNTVHITGYDGGKLTYVLGNNQYYGIKSEEHMYLDLSGFTAWEQENAKFAIYFAFPSSTNETRWSLANSSDGYYPSFCWKVEGQDNDHLYECIVPSNSKEDGRLWNMVIAVRLDPAAVSPNWDQAWNQTQNLSFNSGNEKANMIRVSDWGKGELDAENVISKDARIGFYGQYFLDTVKCSGTGDSDATTAQMWNDVNVAYTNHLASLYQGDIWLTDPDEEGAAIAKAMARYDYIVLFKKYSHDDFINRAASPNKTQYSSASVSLAENGGPWMYLMLACVLAGSAFVASFLVINARKKKSR